MEVKGKDGKWAKYLLIIIMCITHVPFVLQLVLVSYWAAFISILVGIMIYISTYAFSYYIFLGENYLVIERKFLDYTYFRMVFDFKEMWVNSAGYAHFKSKNDHEDDVTLEIESVFFTNSLHLNQGLKDTIEIGTSNAGYKIFEQLFAKS